MSYFQRQQRPQYHDTSRDYEGSSRSTYYDFHSPFSQFYHPRTMRRRAFYVNGVDISHLFNPGGNSGVGIHPFSNNLFRESPMQQQQPWQSVIPNLHRSIFVETITVPLEDLYLGTSRHKFELKDTLFQRYVAAFRGGIAAQIGLQSLLACLPLLFRVSWVASLLGFLVTFHLSLPRPSRLIYFSKLRAGWKGGTKLKFQSVEPGLDVIFIIQEGKHDRFKRDGNNLTTSISVEKSKAQNGCTLLIEPLGKNEPPIKVKLKPGEITKKHHIVTVVGRGWPKPGGGAGDLIVRVDVVSDAKGRRRRFQTKIK
jgi:DnaJ-class molecular chaperone with C-terminal Zn finger domain